MLYLMLVNSWVCSSWSYFVKMSRLIHVLEFLGFELFLVDLVMRLMFLVDEMLGEMFHFSHKRVLWSLVSRFGVKRCVWIKFGRFGWVLVRVSAVLCCWCAQIWLTAAQWAWL
jgi:hypothetical protein